MASDDQLAIDLHDVAKVYRRKVHALRGISMQVHTGEIFGLLGANGAGKTTLVKIMMTIVRPTRARGTLLGRPIGSKPTLAQVGYLPEHHRFPPYLKAKEALAYYAALARVPRAQRKVRIADLLARVGMAEYANARIGTFSKGMMQRIGLAQSMLNDPRLILLDEPTDGVDPIGRRDIRNSLLELKLLGKTVFINSHLLSEVEMICDRVAILHQGLVVRQGRIADLTRDRSYYEIELQIDPATAREAVTAALGCNLVDAAGPAAVQGATAVGVGQLPDGRRVELDGAFIRLAAGDAAGIQGIIDALRRASLTIKAIRPVRQSLEDFFIQTVESQPTEAPGRPNNAPPPYLPASPAAGGRA
ncbi:MAG: ABC transporter ATP-binding protein [Phycisphaerae bacterium]